MKSLTTLPRPTSIEDILPAVGLRGLRWLIAPRLSRQHPPLSPRIRRIRVNASFGYHLRSWLRRERTRMDASSVEIRPVTDRTPELVERLVAVWERSVRATHAFLSDAEVAAIKPFVPQALAGVGALFVAEKDGVPVGFMGVEDGRLEMLFLDPDARGRGLGRTLLTYGIERLGVTELTVNEQNPQAVGFYEHMGFSTYRRTDLDEEGRPYPLLSMRL
ncbi:GNAT family N-acetyltransferase [Olsenella uli]|uniref:GNAT family N-acetyltransferase n=1 Tax=Olsenella uli TaxID=133926 RepID=UPI001DA93819|nr:GNAT family N-acetyltransferase [Olsenella uli]MBM6815872.1 GNAT family N-acetyltransferase [Olsenella uli]